jgi:hypothetical protein
MKVSENGGMDISVDLVQAYLRINGYLTVTEFEVQRRLDDGTYETATDVDIIALRLPGGMLPADAQEQGACQMLEIRDERLLLRPGLIDVILGEVKEGHAEFNPGLKRREVLYSVLRRFEWLYGGALDEIVSGVHEKGGVECPAPGGGTVRTRLVAFGRSETSDLHTISLTHVFDALFGYLERYEVILRPATYKDPAPGLLHLLLKTGFRIEK